MTPRATGRLQCELCESPKSHGVIVSIEKVSRLIYRSRSVLRGDVGSVNSGQVQHILNTAQATNVELGVTGALYFDGSSFGQVLEGPKEGIRRVMENITRDDRHTQVEILAQDDDVPRVFADWTMSYVRNVADTPAVLQLSASMDSNEPSSIVSPDQFALISFIRRSIGTPSARLG
jgi:hypothetical protein